VVAPSDAPFLIASVNFDTSPLSMASHKATSFVENVQVKESLQGSSHLEKSHRRRRSRHRHNHHRSTSLLCEPRVSHQFSPLQPIFSFKILLGKTSSPAFTRADLIVSRTSWQQQICFDHRT
jgi:hypothetical protein